MKKKTNDIVIDENGQWEFYWGTRPLPEGAQALGVITRYGVDKGALIELENGFFVQGNAGVIRPLPPEINNLNSKGQETRFYDSERSCNCGKCRYCKALLLSDDDSGGPCSRCNGAGCMKCE